MSEVVRTLPFPYPNNEFPDSLGAVVVQPVASGERPALYVAHTPDNDWVVGDDVTDPNVPDACVVEHMRHVVESNSSVATLADLPIGWQARRDGPGQPWRRSKFEWDPD